MGQGQGSAKFVQVRVNFTQQELRELRVLNSTYQCCHKNVCLMSQQFAYDLTPHLPRAGHPWSSVKCICEVHLSRNCQACVIFGSLAVTSPTS